MKTKAACQLTKQPVAAAPQTGVPRVCQTHLSQGNLLFMLGQPIIVLTRSFVLLSVSTPSGISPSSPHTPLTGPPPPSLSV